MDDKGKLEEEMDAIREETRAVETRVLGYEAGLATELGGLATQQNANISFIYRKMEKDEVQMVEEGNKYGKAVEVEMKEEMKYIQKDNDEKVKEAFHKVKKRMEATTAKTYHDVKEGFESQEKGFTQALKNEEAAISQVEAENQHLRQQIAELKKRNDTKGQQMSYLAQKDQEKDKQIQQLAQQIETMKRELDCKDKILGAQFTDTADPNRMDEIILAKVEKTTETKFEKFKIDLEEKHAAKINTINHTYAELKKVVSQQRGEKDISKGKDLPRNSMSDISRYLPELILFFDDGRVKHCSKTLKDVSNMAITDSFILDDDNSSSLVPAFIAIQNFLLMKDVSFPFWGEFAVNCCTTSTMKILRRKVNPDIGCVTWEDIILHFFTLHDFYTNDLDRLNSLLDIRIPKSGNIKDFLLKMIHLAAEINTLPVKSILLSIIDRSLKSHYTIKTPRPDDYTSLTELEAFVKVMIPSEIEFQSTFKKEPDSPVGLFAIENRYTNNHDNLFFCRHCSCSRCKTNQNLPYGKKGYCSRYKCSYCQKHLGDFIRKKEAKKQFEAKSPMHLNLVGIDYSNRGDPSPSTDEPEDYVNEYSSYAQDNSEYYAADNRNIDPKEFNEILEEARSEDLPDSLLALNMVNKENPNARQ